MDEHTMFMLAAVLTVTVALSVETLVAQKMGAFMRPSMKALPGALAGAMFMAAMAFTDVAPVATSAAFVAPWALAHVLSSEVYGVSTSRERTKRAALASACGGLGVLVSFRA